MPLNHSMNGTDDRNGAGDEDAVCSMGKLPREVMMGGVMMEGVMIGEVMTGGAMMIAVLTGWMVLVIIL